MKKIFSENIFIPLLLIVTMWFVYFLQTQKFIDQCYGIIPRRMEGLKGILVAPLLHGNVQHIFNNTIPILILGYFCFSVYKKLAYYVLFIGWLMTGLVVWLIGGLAFPSGGEGCHIGASGLVYLLASFLFFSGIIRSYAPLVAVSLTIIFLYGSLIWGIFPQEILNFSTKEEHISWESHLAGALIGLVFAIFLRQYGPKKKTFYWEQNKMSPADEQLWNDYLALTNAPIVVDVDVTDYQKENMIVPKNDFPTNTFPL